MTTIPTVEAVVGALGWIAVCPHCQRRHSIPTMLLGTTVRCHRSRGEYVPVAETIAETDEDAS